MESRHAAHQVQELANLLISAPAFPRSKPRVENASGVNISHFARHSLALSLSLVLFLSALDLSALDWIQPETAWRPRRLAVTSIYAVGPARVKSMSGKRDVSGRPA